VDALQGTQAPSSFSHSSARAVNDHRAMFRTAYLAKIPANGGVVMVNFVPGFIQRKSGNMKRCQRVSGKPAVHGPRWPQVADHIDHIRGCRNKSIGLGSDFDGIYDCSAEPEDVRKFPLLTAELLRRGYSKMISERSSARCLAGDTQSTGCSPSQKERPPSTMVFAGRIGTSVPLSSIRLPP